MRLPKTANRSNDGFQEVRRCGDGGRGGGNGRGDTPGRGPPGRGGRGSRSSQTEKADKTMENKENEEKVSKDSNEEEPMEDEEEPEMTDCIEEYEDEPEEKKEESKTEESKAKNKVTFKQTKEKHENQPAKSFYERALQDDSEAKERMRERGEGYAETRPQYSTQIKIEFNVKAGTTFDVRILANQNPRSNEKSRHNHGYRVEKIQDFREVHGTTERGQIHGGNHGESVPPTQSRIQNHLLRAASKQGEVQRD
eukprot:scaffold63939_cov54-Attheya_sp.AAC.2